MFTNLIKIFLSIIFALVRMFCKLQLCDISDQILAVVTLDVKIAFHIFGLYERNLPGFFSVTTVR
jgi:hypothetical protein